MTSHHYGSGSSCNRTRVGTEALERRVFLSAGDLDASFGGGDGTVTVDLGGDDAVAAVEVMADGRLLAVGRSGDRLAMARFLADGRPDPSFGGGDGAAVTAVAFPSALDAQVRADGKIVIASPDAAYRFNADGSTDTTYGGGDGAVTLDFPDPPPVDDWPPGTPITVGSDGADVAIQADGKVVVAGVAWNHIVFDDPRAYTIHDSALARFREDGTPDPTFGPAGNGLLLTGDNFGSYEEDYRHVVLAPDGTIVASGVSVYVDDPRHIGPTAVEFVHTVAPDGTRRTFSETSPVMPVFDEQLDLRDLSTGAGGEVVTVKDVQWVGAEVRRYPDAAYYFVAQDAPVKDPITRAVPLAGHKVLAAGPAAAGFKVSRFGPTFALDSTFGGGDGSVTAGFGRADATPTALVPLPDGRFVVAAADAGGDFALARFLGDAPPTPAGAYEAEAATISRAAVSTSVPGFSGTGFVDYLHPSGDYVEFAVSVPGDGLYALDFRYANGSAAARALALTVDGAAVAGGVSFAPTGAWTNWRNATVTVPLHGGVNAVRLTAAGQSGPNLDLLLTPRPLASTLTVVGSAGNDRLSVTRSADGRSLFAALNGTTLATRPLAQVSAIVLRGLAGNDTLDVANNITLPATLDGGPGNDLLKGGGGDDALLGGDGDDVLDGRGGADVFAGGAGRDAADYASRSKNVSVGPGVLADDGEAGERDNVGPDVEDVYGGKGSDYLNGSAADNRLYGGPGDDYLVGNGGRDTLSGGAGNDRLFSRDTIKDVLIDGGLGFDTLKRDDFLDTAVTGIEQLLA